MAGFLPRQAPHGKGGKIIVWSKKQPHHTTIPYDKSPLCRRHQKQHGKYQAGVPFSRPHLKAKGILAYVNHSQQCQQTLGTCLRRSTSIGISGTAARSQACLANSEATLYCRFNCREMPTSHLSMVLKIAKHHAVMPAEAPWLTIYTNVFQ